MTKDTTALEALRELVAAINADTNITENVLPMPRTIMAMKQAEAALQATPAATEGERCECGHPENHHASFPTKRNGTPWIPGCTSCAEDDGDWSQGARHKFQPTETEVINQTQPCPNCDYEVGEACDEHVDRFLGEPIEQPESGE